MPRQSIRLVGSVSEKIRRRRTARHPDVAECLKRLSQHNAKVCAVTHGRQPADLIRPRRTVMFSLGLKDQGA